MKDEGRTIAKHRPAPAARGPIAGAILRRCWLLGVVTAAQLAAALALRSASLPRIRRSTTRLMPLARFFVRESTEQVAWAIEATGRRLGGASSCLTRAVVAELLLDPAGGTVRFCIGVRHTDARGLEAHAWITRADRVLVGAPADNYQPIATWTTPTE